MMMNKRWQNKEINLLTINVQPFLGEFVVVYIYDMEVKTMAYSVTIGKEGGEVAKKVSWKEAIEDVRFFVSSDCPVAVQGEICFVDRRLGTTVCWFCREGYHGVPLELPKSSIGVKGSRAGGRCDSFDRGVGDASCLNDDICWWL